MKRQICKVCGAQLKSIIFFCEQCGQPTRPLNLLKGLKDELSKSKDASPRAKEVVPKLAGYYPLAYQEDGMFTLKVMEDTKEYILYRDFKNIINIPLNEEEAANNLVLAEQFAANSQVVDDIAQDIVVIGYLYRILENGLKIEPVYSIFKDPETMLTTLIENIGNYENWRLAGSPTADTGFSIPMLLDGDCVKNTIFQNLKSEYEPAKLLDISAVHLLMVVGWCLARFDIARSNAI